MMKKVYSCDICKDGIKDPAASFGLNFSTREDFTLGGYGCTDGTHICYRCARQLAGHLAKPEIVKLLSKEPQCSKP